MGTARGYSIAAWEEFAAVLAASELTVGEWRGAPSARVAQLSHPLIQMRPYISPKVAC